MRRAALILATLGCLTTGASADSGRLGGLGAEIFGDSFFHFNQQNLKSFPISTIRAGRIRISLQHTRLSELQRQYGGTLYDQGAGMNAAHWLCYASPQSTTWFISNVEGGNEFVMMVATAAGGAEGSCDAAPAGFAAPDYGIPAIGASVDELRSHFGSASTGSHSTVSYRVDRPARDGLGTADDAQYLGYVVRGSTVVGIGVGETTAAQ